MRRTSAHADRSRFGGLLSLLTAIALVLSVAGGFVVSVVTAPPAAAAGATPQVVFDERFENLNVSATTASLVSTTNPYIGVNGEIYTAATYWQSEEVCNGIVTQYNTTAFASGMCQEPTAQISLRMQAYALSRYDQGQYGPWTVGTAIDATAANNAAITEYTQNNAGYLDYYPTPSNCINCAPNLPIIEMTTDPIPAAQATAGWYDVSIDVAEDNCFVGVNTTPVNPTNSALTFWLSTNNGTSFAQQNAAPISACTDPDRRDIVVPVPVIGPTWNYTTTAPTNSNTIRVARVNLGRAVFLTAAQVQGFRLRVTNANSSGWGNDFAFDNLRLTRTAPATMSVTKDVDGRWADTDQFTVAVRNADGTVLGAPSIVTGVATTSGSGATVTAGTGVTNVQFANPLGVQYQITEFAAGTTDLSKYQKFLTCTNDATATGTNDGLPTNLDVTSSLPYVLTPVAGSIINCTIRNVPIIDATDDVDETVVNTPVTLSPMGNDDVPDGSTLSWPSSGLPAGATVSGNSLTVPGEGSYVINANGS